MNLSRRTRHILAWTGVTVGVLIGAVLLALVLIDWNAMKGPIERMASARSGRTVKIAGDIEVHPWSWTPSFAVSGLTVGNPPWEASRPMAQIERLQVQIKLLPLLKGDVILPRVEIIRPQVYLHREESGRANWTFENTTPTNEKAGPPPHLPVVRDFLIDGGKLTVNDELLKLTVDGTIVAREKASESDPKAFKIQGKGKINQQPFAANIAGGPLINLQPDQPYPFDLAIEAGDIRIGAKGQVKKPFDLARVSLAASASGGDLADLYHLTHLAMPNTPPFKLAANIVRDVSKIHVTGLKGEVGRSDLSGDLLIDVSRKRPVVTGQLKSDRLRLADLAAPLGGKPKTAGTLSAQTEKAKPSKKGAEEAAPANATLFPTARLQVARVRAMDGDVKFSARSIEAGSLPLKEVAFEVKLDDGVLSLAPFAFEMPQGKLSGTVHIDARGDKPKTRLDVRVKDVQLDQLKGKAPDAKPPLGGIVQARATFEGTGDSVHDFMADANGRVSAVVPRGQVNAAFAELTGINVARGIGLLITGNDERAEIRCGVAQFDVKQGTMHAANVVFDTTDVKITGQGDVRLGPEELDLSIKGQPKKLRFARLRTPVEINGHLRKPSIGIDAGDTVKQGAVAAALGAALTPVAALLAFIDPGLAKDENCAALLESAKSPPTKTASKEEPKTPARR
jgi:AsmA family protein